MTLNNHDPKCPAHGFGPGQRIDICICTGIRIGRADEREKHAREMAKESRRFIALRKEMEARMLYAKTEARADERKRIEKFAIPAWREEIAQDIESLMLEPKDHCIEEYNNGVTNAARIVRGEQT